MSERPIGLAELGRELAKRASNGRVLVALAGPPGSGKSTVAAELADNLNETTDTTAAIFPMDGYHFDDAVLEARGLLARKGSPETFDVLGLRYMLERLRRNDEDEIAVPVFDRSLEISRAGARLIGRGIRVIIVEGNYLLLRSAPWSTLAALFDVTVAINTPEDELRRRLTNRWFDLGISAELIPAKVEANDLPNGRFVITNSIPADFVLQDVDLRAHSIAN